MENNLPTFEDVSPAEVILSVEDLNSIELNEDVEQEVVQDDSEFEVELEAEHVEEQSVESDSVSDPVAVAFYESLVEKGVLQSDDTFDGSFSYVEQQLDELPKKLLNKAIDELPAHSQQVLKFIAVAGQNLQKEELDNFMREHLNEQVLPSIDTLDSARSFLEAHLTSELEKSGLKDSVIRLSVQSQLDELEDSDELISEATKVLSSKERKTDSLIAGKDAENKQIQESQNQFYQSVTTVLAESNWSKPQQEKVLQTIPKTNSIIGEVIKNPKAYIQMIDFLSKFDGKEFNLESFRKQGEARATSSLKEKLESSNFSSSGTRVASSSSVPKDESTEQLLKESKLIV